MLQYLADPASSRAKPTLVEARKYQLPYMSGRVAAAANTAIIAFIRENLTPLHIKSAKLMMNKLMERVAAAPNSSGTHERAAAHEFRADI